ncbi:MAG: hypothetical protein ABUL58_06385 [Steroidobacter sp.]
MKKLFLTFGVVISLTLLVACKPEVVSTLKDADAVTVYYYRTDKTVDRVVDKRIIKKDSPGLKAIIKWAKDNGSNWEPSNKVFLPDLIIEGKGFSLNVRKDFIVFNYKDGTYIRKTIINEYPWFKQQLGIVEPAK